MTNEINVGKKGRPSNYSDNEVSDVYFSNPELYDVEGIGPATAKKLKEAGIVSVMDLAVTSAEQLTLYLDCSKNSAALHIMAAQKLLQESNILEKEFVSADVVLKKRKSMQRCSTGSKSLDDLLLGGIETQAVTEFYGEFGSGKSQICHTLCAMASRPRSEKGLNGRIIYIDTEGTFRPERLEEIASSRRFVPLEVLKKVLIYKVYISSNLESIINSIGKFIDKFNARLIIVDSIVSLHRAEFIGRGALAERQQRLNSILHRLIRIAEIYDVAIVITNQVQTSPDTFFGDSTKAAGGNVIGHTSTYRIYLRKSGDNRMAKMVDSPYHPYSDTQFTINEKGIDDLEDSTTERRT